jgi:hypothetical protein
MSARRAATLSPTSVAALERFGALRSGRLVDEENAAMGVLL